MRLSLIVLLLFACPLAAHADRADMLVRGGDETTSREVVAALRASGAVPAESARAFFEAEPLEPATRQDLVTLDAVEHALRDARAHAAELDERRALGDVARAQRHASALVSMPTGRVFLAEVEITLALVAWQLGDRSLAEASLTRAIALDPRRRLRAADADPDLVALADAILAASERRPRVSVVVNADVEASVFVDDMLIGHTPARVETRAGTHVIRVVAPMHAPYATLVAIERDLTLDLALSPRPVATLVARLERALDAGELDEAVVLLTRLAEEGRPLRVALVREDRVVLCASTGCSRPMSADALEANAPLTERASESIAALGVADDSARIARSEQLRDERRALRARERRRRRIIGISAGLASALAVTTVALVARPTDERLRVHVDFE